MKRLKNRRIQTAVERRQSRQALMGVKRKTRYQRFLDFIHKLESDPLAKLIAFVGAFVTFALPLWQIYLDAPERQAERLARAWQSLATPATGNSGKTSSIEFLVSNGISLDGIDLSCKTMSGGLIENSECKNRTVLRGLNLEGMSANLSRSNFSGVDLSHSNLQGTNLEDATFEHSVAIGTNFSGTGLMGTTFKHSDLSKSKFSLGLSSEDSTTLFANLQKFSVIGSNITDVNFNIHGAIISGIENRDNYVVRPYAPLTPKPINFTNRLAPDFLCNRGFRSLSPSGIELLSAARLNLWEETFESFVANHCTPFDPNDRNVVAYEERPHFLTRDALRDDRLGLSERSQPVQLIEEFNSPKQHSELDAGHQKGDSEAE